MSKQSNQRYRKELEKEVLTKNSIDSDDCVNNTKNTGDTYDYGDGDFDQPSNATTSKNISK